MSSCIKQESSTLKGICYSIFMHNSSLHSVSGNRGRTNVKLFFACKPLNAMGWNYLLKISFTTFRGISAPRILLAPQSGSMLKISMLFQKEFVCIVLKCTKVFTRFVSLFSWPQEHQKAFGFHTLNDVDDKYVFICCSHFDIMKYKSPRRYSI